MARVLLRDAMETNDVCMVRALSTVIDHRCSGVQPKARTQYPAIVCLALRCLALCFCLRGCSVPSSLPMRVHAVLSQCAAQASGEGFQQQEASWRHVVQAALSYAQDYLHAQLRRVACGAQPEDEHAPAEEAHWPWLLLYKACHRAVGHEPQLAVSSLLEFLVLRHVAALAPLRPMDVCGLKDLAQRLQHELERLLECAEQLFRHELGRAPRQRFACALVAQVRLEYEACAVPQRNIANPDVLQCMRALEQLSARALALASVARCPTTYDAGEEDASEKVPILARPAPSNPPARSGHC